MSVGHCINHNEATLSKFVLLLTFLLFTCYIEGLIDILTGMIPFYIVVSFQNVSISMFIVA